MNLHLYIPSLFWSDTTIPEIYQDLYLPSLEKLLAKSKIEKTDTTDFSAWLCNTFKIEKQHDWPVAPVMLQTDKNNHITVSDKDYWLRADPVHLRVEQNHIMLADSNVFELTQDEAVQYTSAINQCLNDELLIVLPFHSSRWYIRLKDRPEIHTHTLSSATCQNINNLLPTGNDSGKWRKMFNEIQMLLHDHPLNLERAARNQIVINSVWFWGGGLLPQSIQPVYSNIWSDEPFSRALADFSLTPYKRLPDNIAKWLQEYRSENWQFIVLDSLLNHDKYNNALAWRENLKKLEKTWFTPLYTALKNNQIKTLKISTTNENAALNFIVTSNSLWKFWATIKPLSFYADNQT
ncbi:MAG: phosphoglycerate mutase [Burkholderiales bacterium]|nr:phosphoglycerate mutase [Burkholderiales bacterium]